MLPCACSCKTHFGQPRHNVLNEDTKLFAELVAFQVEAVYLFTRGPHLKAKDGVFQHSELSISVVLHSQTQLEWINIWVAESGGTGCSFSCVWSHTFVEQTRERSWKKPRQLIVLFAHQTLWRSSGGGKENPGVSPSLHGEAGIQLFGAATQLQRVHVWRAAQFSAGCYPVVMATLQLIWKLAALCPWVEALWNQIDIYCTAILVEAAAVCVSHAERDWGWQV